MATGAQERAFNFMETLADSLREFDRRLLAVENRLNELEARHDESQIEAALRLERKRLKDEQIARGEEFFNKSTRASAE